MLEPKLIAIRVLSKGTRHTVQFEHVLFTFLMP